MQFLLIIIKELAHCASFFQKTSFSVLIDRALGSHKSVHVPFYCSLRNTHAPITNLTYDKGKYVTTRHTSCFKKSCLSNVLNKINLKINCKKS